MYGLIVGQVDVNPEPVRGQQVGHVGNAEFLAGASYIYFHLWPCQIKRIVRPGETHPRSSEHGNRQSQSVRRQPGNIAMKYLSGCHIHSFRTDIGTSAKRSGSLTRREYESAFVCDRRVGGYDSIHL
jgi:hypothetical protein